MPSVIAAVTKLSSRVIRILGCNPGPMTLQGTNTYLIGTGNLRVLLDAGDKSVEEYQKNLRSLIEKENVNISHIIITHWHHDHIGGVEDIYGKITGECQVWKHKKSSEDKADSELDPSIPLNWLHDGQTIAVEGATLRVHHTPGHTTDHVVLTLEEDKVLFSGDCILGEGTAIFEDLYSYMKSLDRISELRPDVIYPGHGNIVEDPIPKITHYISHRKQRESQILDKLHQNADKPLTEMDLVEMIYTETPRHLWPAAAYNVNHHLTKLVKDGKVNVIETDGTSKWQFASPNSSL